MTWNYTVESIQYEHTRNNLDHPNNEPETKASVRFVSKERDKITNTPRIIDMHVTRDTISFDTQYSPYASFAFSRNTEGLSKLVSNLKALYDIDSIPIYVESYIRVQTHRIYLDENDYPQMEFEQERLFIGMNGLDYVNAFKSSQWDISDMSHLDKHVEHVMQKPNTSSLVDNIYDNVNTLADDLTLDALELKTDNQMNSHMPFVLLTPDYRDFYAMRPGVADDIYTDMAENSVYDWNVIDSTIPDANDKLFDVVNVYKRLHEKEQ